MRVFDVFKIARMVPNREMYHICSAYKTTEIDEMAESILLFQPLELKHTIK